MIKYISAASVLLVSIYAYAIDYDYVISQDEHCMALNIYHEARSDNLAGKFAVADVVINRVYDTRYPNTVCGVIYQGDHKPSWKDPNTLVPVRNRCQFSWYCDGKSDTPHDDEAWEKSRKFARDMYIHGEFRGITEGATHYHATYSKPFWSKKLNRIARI